MTKKIQKPKFKSCFTGYLFNKITAQKLKFSIKELSSELSFPSARN